MSRKIHKITRNLMMVALSLSLLLGLGFVLSPSVSAAEPGGWTDGMHVFNTTREEWQTIGVFLGSSAPENGVLWRNATVGATNRTAGGNNELDLNGRSLTLSGEHTGAATLLLRGPGTVTYLGGLTSEGVITLGTVANPIDVVEILRSGVTNLAPAANLGLGAADLSLETAAKIRLQDGTVWGGATNTGNITVHPWQTLEIVADTFARTGADAQVTFLAGSRLYRAGGNDLTLDLPHLQGGEGRVLAWTGSGTLRLYAGTATRILPDNLPVDIRNGSLSVTPAQLNPARTASLSLNGTVLDLVGVARGVGDTLGNFPILLGGSGGTIYVNPSFPLQPNNPAVLNLNVGTTFSGRTVGRPLEIRGHATINNWRTETVRGFFGTILLTPPTSDEMPRNATPADFVITMRTTADIFDLEDGKILNIPQRAVLDTGGRFIIGSASEWDRTTAVMNNNGLINLGGNFEVRGRSDLNNRAGATIALNTHNLILAGSVQPSGIGTRFLNEGTVTGVANSSIIVEGGPDNALGVSGLFVNEGRVGTGADNPALALGTINLTVGGSSNAGVEGASVINNNEMHLRNVQVNPGLPAGQGGTLDNNRTMGIHGTWSVGRAGSATGTGGALNNDGYLRLEFGSAGTVVGGVGPNVDAGVLTNSEDAEMFLVGQLTLGGSGVHADAGGVEFTNEGELTVYSPDRFGNPLVGSSGLIRIESGTSSAPSARLVNEGSLMLGSDQLNWGRTGRIEFGIRNRGDDGGSRATLVNNGDLDVLGTSSIRVDTDLRAGLYRLGLVQNTANGLIRVTATTVDGEGADLNRLPTGTFENAGVVTFTFNAKELTTPATDVFGATGIAIGVGPYLWDTWAGDHVPRGALPFAGLGHRQILSVYGNGGRFGVGRLSPAGFNEIHMTAGEARLVNISVLNNFVENFNLRPTLGTERLVGFSTQRDGSGVFFEVDEPIEVIGSLQPGRPNPDVVWAQWVRPTPGISFGDVGAGRFYAAAVRWAANTDPAIARGFGDNTFRPSRDLNRGEFVTMLYRLAGEPSVANWSNPFSDVGTGFYANAVTWAYNHGIVTGFDGTTQFRPGERMRRQDVATTLYRMANASPAPANALHGFPDAGDISPHAVNAVNWAVSEGIMGRGIGELRPLGRINRGEAVTMIFRAYERGLLPSGLNY